MKIARQVWGFNAEFEFSIIRNLLPNFKFASFDTEFPGVIYKPTSHPKTLTPQKRYAFLKANVDILKLIQLGLTLSNPETNLEITWEFNFREFDPFCDPNSPDSVQLLQSQGINFVQNKIFGIDSRYFAELLYTSGLLCNSSRLTWVTFHGASDFGYLVKMIMGRRLPNSVGGFMSLVKWYFGNNILDVKYLVKFCGSLYGGLEKVGTELGVEREIGSSHQAGSDSLLTWRVYERMKERFFVSDGGLKHAGIIFGIQES